MLFEGQIYPDALPIIAARSKFPVGVNTTILAVGRLGRNLGGATETEAAASQIARLQAVKLAQKSIKLSRQMLDDSIVGKVI
jgi:hypothetical protein